MSIATIRKGATALVDGEECVLVRFFREDAGGGVWQLENIRTGRPKELTQVEMWEKYVNGSFKFTFEPGTPKIGKVLSPDLAEQNFNWLPEHIKSEAKSRLSYIKAAEALFDRRYSKADVKAVLKENWLKVKWPVKAAPGISTLFRWRSAYERGGRDIRSLVSHYNRKGDRTDRVEKEVRELVSQAIDKIYMSQQRGTYRETLEYAEILIKRANSTRLADEHLSYPSYHFIKREIASIPAFDRHVARYGKESADNKFRFVHKKKYSDYLLERVEIDHTKLDVFVIDEETLLPLGRPTLTIAIEDRSRAVPGYDLSFEPASYLTVARCLKMAILPKAGRATATANGWPMHGIMRTLVVDNALEFHGFSLEGVALELGIEIEYGATKTPWHKGKVERLIGTINRSIAHITPGTTFANILEKEDYDPLKHAVVTLGSLRAMLDKWICDVYHQTIHRGIGDTPANVWEFESRSVDLMLPENPDQFVAALGQLAERRLTHKGIEINNLFYNSPEAVEILRGYGHTKDKHRVTFMADDLGEINLLNPATGKFVTLRCTDYEYAKGVTLWQHKVIRRYAIEYMNGRVDKEALITAKDEIRQIIEDSLGTKKKKSRAKEGRYLNRTSQLNDEVGDKAQMQVVPKTQEIQVQVSKQSRGSAGYEPVVIDRQQAINALGV